MRDSGRIGTRLLLFVSFCVVLFMVADWFTSGAVRQYMRPVFSPVVGGAERVARVFSQNEFWKTRRALQDEVAKLTEELARRDVGTAITAALQSENDLLRGLMGISDSGVTVPITSSFSSSPYGTFSIGGGSSRGIHEGDVVLARDGFVLGTVTDVSINSAVVRAIFAPGIPSEVVVGEVGFSLSGRGGGNAYAEVPREAPLVERALVIAPFLDNRPVGIIGKIESASSSAFADVYVSFPFNPNTLRFVKVVPRL